MAISFFLSNLTKLLCNNFNLITSVTRLLILSNSSLPNMWELNQVACDSTKLNTTLSIYVGTFFFTNSKYLCRKGFLLSLSKTSFCTLATESFLRQMGSLQGLQILCFKGGQWVLLAIKVSQVSGKHWPQ